MGHGLQFCPACLAEDEVPYFRKRWRVAFYTCCTKHSTMMHDRCPACGFGVAFHRIELGRYGAADEEPLTFCHECGFDLRNALLVAPTFYEDSSRQIMEDVLRMLEGEDGRRFDAGFFNTLHQICKILLSDTRRVKLCGYVTGMVGAPDFPLQLGKRSFEERLLHERHYVIQLGMWLMAEPAIRIVAAWRTKAVRYNELNRDFRKEPKWYRELVRLCNLRN